MEVSSIDYILPVWSLLVCSAFAILLNGIKKSGQFDKDKDDVRGLNSLIISFLCWAFSGLIHAIALYGSWGNSEILTCIRACFSTINSLFILNAVPSIKINQKYEGKKLVDLITSKLFLIIIGAAFTVLTIALTVALTSKENISEIWWPDTLLSILAVCVLAKVILIAFRERKMNQFLWLVYGTLFFLMVTVALQLCSADSLKQLVSTATNTDLTMIGAIVSASYKTVLFMLILVLLYSWQLSQKLITEKEIVNSGIKFIADPDKKYYGIEVKASLSEKWTEIAMGHPSELFLRLLKLAIHKKIDNAGMPYIGQQAHKTDNSKYEYFTHRNKTDILGLAKKSFPDFAQSFFSHPDKKEIRLLTLPENIILPPGNIEDGASANDIFKNYVKHYKTPHFKSPNE